MKHYAKNYVKELPTENPVFLVANIKSSAYNLTGLKEFKDLRKEMKAKKVKNFKVCPIIVNSSTKVNRRANMIENFVAKNFDSSKHEKINFLCYSFANLPLHLFLHNSIYAKYVRSALFVGSPNK